MYTNNNEDPTEPSKGPEVIMVNTPEEMARQEVISMFANGYKTNFLKYKEIRGENDPLLKFVHSMDGRADHISPSVCKIAVDNNIFVVPKMSGKGESILSLRYELLNHDWVKDNSYLVTVDDDNTELTLSTLLLDGIFGGRVIRIDAKEYSKDAEGCEKMAQDIADIVIGMGLRLPQLALMFDLRLSGFGAIPDDFNGIVLEAKVLEKIKNASHVAPAEA